MTNRIVIKRDGKEEAFETRKIVNAIYALLEGISIQDDYEIVYKIIKELDLKVPSRVSTEELDTLLLKAIEALVSHNPLFDRMAARQLRKILGRGIDQRFSGFAEMIRYGVQEDIYQRALLDFDLEALEKEIDPSRNDLLEYAGLLTLSDRYLTRDRKRSVMEKPQWFFMRVAMGIGSPGAGQEEVIRIYNKLSHLEYLHSTPTLYNSGLQASQYSSCYVNVVDDSLDSIMEKLKETAFLAKYAGGVGTDVTRIRATGSPIRSLNAHSSGIIPFVKIFDTTVNAIQQGGRRRSSQVIYLQPWHLDVEAFLDLRDTNGNAYFRTPSLNTAFWMPDEMMRRINENEDLYLFDPGECPGLIEQTGARFAELYRECIRKAEEGTISRWKKVPARDFFRKYLFKLAKTGHPWLTFKDAHNRTNPCPAYSMIHSSNLCTEISIPNHPGSTAVCTLASVNLSRHLNRDQTDFDWERLEETLVVCVDALDSILDRNFYPSEASRRNTLDLRPIGIGVMGFAEALTKMRIAYDSDKAIELAGKIGAFMRRITYARSESLADEKGPFPHYEEQARKKQPYPYPPRRNAVLLAIAPTASISIIAGTTSGIDSLFSNLYSRDTLSGKHLIVNRNLVDCLEENGLWNERMAGLIKQHNGSVQHIRELDDVLDKTLFKTAYEINPRRQVDIAAAFQQSVDQAVSRSLYLTEEQREKMEEIYLYAWKSGLKSTYYCFIDKKIRGEKYTETVNKRGTRKGFGGTKATGGHPDAAKEPAVEMEESESSIEQPEVRAREKFGDEIVDQVMEGNAESCPTDPLLRLVCPSCD